MTTLHLGDCLEVMRTLPDCSVHAIVTDPPYGLAFMGKRWDYDVPSVEVWGECLRVLKPGGHLLAFAGTRTQHRMAVRIEDAGFEIRDMIAWVYGSGFPKSLDVSKAIDKAAGAEREVVGSKLGRPGMAKDGSNQRQWAAEALLGEKRLLSTDITAPATPEAQQWAGWGTALKPALEPITMARKPLAGTVAANVLEHGTGALNVDGCRVGISKEVPASVSRKAPANCYGKYAEAGETPGIGGHDPNLGRWPANLIHDGSDEPAKLLGDAARFFYTAKASRADRGHGNNHPTVKPLDLMAYLCRLVTPPGGTVLDPFMGSGTTIKAALSEGFDAIGIERDPAYYAIAQERLNGAQIGLAFPPRNEKPA
jgi:DNA modification methylase